MPEWLEFLLADTSALQLVFWVAAIGALVAVIVKLWPALSQFVAIMNAVTGLPSFIDRTDTRIDEIHHEVHYNNGTSVKDAQRRTEEAVARIEEGVAGLYTKVDELVESDDDIRQKLINDDDRIDALEEIERTRPHPPKE